jgi:hypothetical protein
MDDMRTGNTLSLYYSCMVDDGALNNIKRIEFYDLGCCYYLQLDFKQLAKLLNARLTI